VKIGQELIDYAELMAGLDENVGFRRARFNECGSMFQSGFGCGVLVRFRNLLVNLRNITLDVGFRQGPVVHRHRGVMSCHALVKLAGLGNMCP
jgi:hypothetical protein